MKQALLLIKDRPEYRYDAFQAAAQRHGFQLVPEAQFVAKPGDLVVSWNMHINELRLREYQKKGATLLVAENGYLGTDDQGVQYYAIGNGGHNGSGKTPAPSQERWERLNTKLAEWQPNPEGHIVVAVQRGIGSSYMRMPEDWETKTTSELRARTFRPLLIRRHPGRFPPKTTLAQDLRDAYAMVTWSSNSATSALIGGIPVFYTAPHIITAKAAKQGLAEIEDPFLGDRLPAFYNLASAQWNLAEIESGEAFAKLLAL